MGKKRIVSMLLAFAMIFSSVFGGITVQAAGFSDMPNNWAKEGLEHAVDLGLLMGDKNGKLNPTGNLTRGELATIATRMLNLKEEASLDKFVDAEHWSKEYMAKAVAAGIFIGDGNKLYPQNPIKRQEVFAIFQRVFALKAEADHLGDFTDGKEITQEWVKDAANALIENDYILGDQNGRINPKDNIRRQELATMLLNMVDDIVGKDLKNKTYEGNLIINDENVSLEGVKVGGDLILAEGIQASDINLVNSSVAGRIVVREGEGLNLEGTEVGEIVVLAGEGTLDIDVDEKSEVAKIVTNEKINVTGEGKVDTIVFKEGSNESKVETPNTKVELDGVKVIYDKAGNKVEKDTTVNVDGETPTDPEDPEKPTDPTDPEDPETPENPVYPEKSNFREKVVVNKGVKSLVDLVLEGKKADKALWVEVLDKDGKTVVEGFKTTEKPGFGLIELEMEKVGDYKIVVTNPDRDEEDTNEVEIELVVIDVDFVESITKEPMKEKTDLNLLKEGSKLDMPVWVEVLDEEGKLVGEGGTTLDKPGYGVAQIQLETEGNYTIVVKDEKAGVVLGEVKLTVLDTAKVEDLIERAKKIDLIKNMTPSLVEDAEEVIREIREVLKGDLEKDLEEQLEKELGRLTKEYYENVKVEVEEEKTLNALLTAGIKKAVEGEYTTEDFATNADKAKMEKVIAEMVEKDLEEKLGFTKEELKDKVKVTVTDKSFTYNVTFGKELEIKGEAGLDLASRVEVEEAYKAYKKALEKAKEVLEKKEAENVGAAKDAISTKVEVGGTTSLNVLEFIKAYPGILGEEKVATLENLVSEVAVGAYNYKAKDKESLKEELEEEIFGEFASGYAADMEEEAIKELEDTIKGQIVTNIYDNLLEVEEGKAKSEEGTTTITEEDIKDLATVVVTIKDNAMSYEVTFVGGGKLAGKTLVETTEEKLARIEKELKEFDFNFVTYKKAEVQGKINAKVNEVLKEIEGIETEDEARIEKALVNFIKDAYSKALVDTDNGTKLTLKADLDKELVKAISACKANTASVDDSVEKVEKIIEDDINALLKAEEKKAKGTEEKKEIKFDVKVTMDTNYNLTYEVNYKEDKSVINIIESTSLQPEAIKVVTEKDLKVDEIGILLKGGKVVSYDELKGKNVDSKTVDETIKDGIKTDKITFKDRKLTVEKGLLTTEAWEKIKSDPEADKTIPYKVTVVDMSKVADEKKVSDEAKLCKLAMYRDGTVSIEDIK